MVMKRMHEPVHSFSPCPRDLTNGSALKYRIMKIKVWIFESEYGNRYRLLADPNRLQVNEPENTYN